MAAETVTPNTPATSGIFPAVVVPAGHPDNSPAF
jgi:hypothetical protein